jgi:hypothetical protein
MRLKSAIWVMAYVRAVQSAGAAAFVVRRGDEAAGAIFVKVNRLDGTAELFGPAPAGEARADLDRVFTARFPGREGVPEAEVDAALAAEVRYDADLWIVEVEDRQGRHGLGDAVVTA